MTAPLVLFPDVESWLVAYLAGALADRDEPYTDNVAVLNAVPAPPASRPDRMVTVRRYGGPRIDVVRELARIYVNVWALTDADATDLANMVRALIVACPDGNPVCKVVEQSGPSTVPDESDQPQRLFVVDLTVRGTAA